MAKQLIFCLETNKRANTDYIYIKEAIDFLYQKADKSILAQYIWAQKPNTAPKMY